ncbi:MAG TPA: class I SAM-dependent methyltransferase [Thermoleophilaceae bacterium]
MDVEKLKEGTRKGWSQGDYSLISERLRPVAHVLVDECAISAGQEVLDAAAGDGNVAIAAAEEGASVTACDITPMMIERGRERSEAEGVDIEWVEGDVEALPFADESFECVTSAFGLFLAPRPELAAREVFRVLRPGGTFGMTAWTREGFMGQVFEMNSRFDPGPPGLPATMDWGNEAIVQSRLEGLAGSVRTERRTLRWEFDAPESYWNFLGKSGPTAARRAALEAGQLEQMRAALFEIIDRFNQADDGSVSVEGEYLLTVARKRG